MVLGNACAAALSLGQMPHFLVKESLYTVRVKSTGHSMTAVCLESDGPPSEPERDFRGPGTREALPATLMSTAALQLQGGGCVNINF